MMALAFGNGEASTLSIESHRPVPAPFLIKTYQLVDDTSTDEIVSWGDDGTTFIVWRPPEFARDLLPNYFKHNNFSSFVRQLNTYGFRKTAPYRWEFANDYFRKGHSHLLCEIYRRKTAAAQVSGNVLHPGRSSPSTSGEEQTRSSRSSPTSSPKGLASATNSMSDENERLRRDNQILLSELSRLQRCYDNALTFLHNETKIPLHDLKEKLHSTKRLLFPLEQSSFSEGNGLLVEQPYTASKTEENLLLKAVSQNCFSNLQSSNENFSRVQSSGNASHASTIAFVHGKLRELTAYTKAKDEALCVSGPKLFGVPLYGRKRLHPDLNSDSDLASDSVQLSATTKELKPDIAKKLTSTSVEAPWLRCSASRDDRCIFKVA
ncbi:hypothetical protein O6H91_14G079200 [Diphasiastrum complanatum]|uniref:Uncharacterized protein n=3 Tax=Diphasiastrum complanatum TaxID=34168 RepID=A0ACC2BRC7_DIPCM|nr:hypothetical protein O6H91_14G079000 [Diphasiastrum complanatum]KAJ7532237.1 hypothetical protein O6H91_14G079000 [Diphasiastrum complanatum]KAJ7532239.1 hypothetical protein O6H91_14G079200 [Diphasiastrum complanatum]